MNQAERLGAIETALMRAHCLSKAIGFLLLNEDAEPTSNGSTWRAALEEVNNCAHESIQTAINHAEELARELRKDGVV